MYNTINVNRVCYVLDLSYMRKHFLRIFDIKFSNKVIEQSDNIIYRAQDLI